MRVYVRALCAALALAGSACGGVIDPSRNVTESFSGSLDVLGSDIIHEFNSGNGEVDIRFTEITPAAPYLGVAWGQVINGVCNLLQPQPFGQLNRSAITGQINSGRYCLYVYDWGTLAGPTTYTVRVSHP